MILEISPEWKFEMWVKFDAEGKGFCGKNNEVSKGKKA